MCRVDVISRNDKQQNEEMLERWSCRYHGDIRLFSSKFLRVRCLMIKSLTALSEQKILKRTMVACVSIEIVY